MTFANADLIDGDSPYVIQGRIGESSPEIVFFDFPDHVPCETEKIGNVFDCHAASELQCVCPPALGVASAGVGKVSLDLANGPAIMALHAR